MLPIDKESISNIADTLEQGETLNYIKRYVNWIYNQGDSQRAYRFYLWLDDQIGNRPNIKENYHHEFIEYQQMLGTLGLMALPHFDIPKIINYFEKYITYGLLVNEPDIVEQVEANLLTIIDHEERNILKQKLKEALLNNNLPLVDSVSETGKRLSLSNWIKDYFTNVGSGKVDPLRREQYLSQSEAIKTIEQSKKFAVRKLILLFDYLNKSSLTPEGLEEKVTFIEDGKKIILDKGQVRELDSESDMILNRLLDLKNKKIDSEIEKVTKPILDDTKPESPIRKIDEIKQSLPVTLNAEFIQSIPQSFKSTKPALIFNIEDEKEVDKHRDKAGEPPVLEHVLRAFVDEIIKQKNLVFRDEVNQRRFVQLMVSRLKDVRGPLEIAEVLRKPIEAGGLGMTEEKADQVQAIMEEAKQEFDARVKNQSLKIPEPIIETPPPPAPIKVTPAKPSYDAEAARAWREQMLREIQAKTEPIVPESSQQTVPKPQLADVKVPPKVVGPLEELRSLNLVDFRRLGASPPEALQKIRGKIDLLGETSIGRRVEAVRAWKSSSVYQLYLRLGQESIEQGQHINVIVENHQNLGDPVLTEDEFTAIADFNAQLRF